MYYEGYPFRDYSPCFDNNRCNLQLSSEYDGIIDTTGKVLIIGRNIYEPDYYDGYIVENKEGISLYTKDLQCVLANKERITSFRVGIVYKDSLSDNLMLIRSGCSEATPVYTLFDMQNANQYLKDSDTLNVIPRMNTTRSTSATNLVRA